MRCSAHGGYLETTGSCAPLRVVVLDPKLVHPSRLIVGVAVNFVNPDALCVRQGLITSSLVGKGSNPIQACEGRWYDLGSCSMGGCRILGVKCATATEKLPGFKGHARVARFVLEGI